MGGAAERNDPVEKTIGTWVTPGFTLSQEYARPLRYPTPMAQRRHVALARVVPVNIGRAGVVLRPPPEIRDVQMDGQESH